LQPTLTRAKVLTDFSVKHKEVACVPGEAFYYDGGGENLARFCFAKEDDVLNEACRRIERLKL
jgi:aminotransferase